jgi:hypothetical protein
MTPRGILNFEVQPSLTRAMQRIVSADTPAAANPQTTGSLRASSTDR